MHLQSQLSRKDKFKQINTQYIACYPLNLPIMHNILQVNYQSKITQEVIKDLGIRIRDYRINQGLTMAELSQKSGVSTRTISGFERQGQNISLSNFIELLRALGLLDNLQKIAPELPLLSPIEILKREQKKPKRVKKK